MTLNSNMITGLRGAVRISAAVLAVSLLAVPAYAGGSLTVAQRDDPTNLDPIDTFLISWGAVASNFFDGLVQRNEDLQLEPGLATSWEFLDDETRIRFTLREGVTFHNGEPFNAAAVKFTFERLLGEEGEKGPQRSNYTAISSIEIVDDFTVDFVLSTPDPVLITKLAGYGAMIVPPKYLEEVGEEAFDNKPVGTGPFKVVKYTPTVDLKLAKFDDYWGGEAGVDDLTIRFISEPSTRVAELLSGGVDIAQDIPVSSTSAIVDNEGIDLTAVQGPTVVFLRTNLKEGITTDVRVRKAIAMAVDRQAIIDSILEGYASPIASIQGAKSFGYDPDLEPHPYDPAAAKALLAEAGVAPGSEVAIDFPSSDDTVREVAQAISGYLAAAGLKADLISHEASVYWSEIMPDGQTQEMFTFQWGGWTFDFDNTAYLLYHSGEFWNPYVADEKLDELLESQRLTFDRDTREETLRAVAAYAHENALDIPLYNTDTLYGVSKRVKGFVPAPDNRARYMSVTFED